MDIVQIPVFDRIEVFVKKYPELLSPNINLYNYSCRINRTKAKDRSLIVPEEVIEEGRRYIEEVVKLYRSEFEEISAAFLNKAEVINKMETICFQSKEIIERSAKCFHFNDEIITFLKLTQEFQRVVEIYETIEGLLSVPNKVDMYMKEDDYYSAFDTVSNAIKKYNSRKLHQIASLQDIYTKLLQCNESIENHVFDFLLRQLFSDELPEGITFFTSVDAARFKNFFRNDSIQKCGSLLLKMGRTEQFLKLFIDQVNKMVPQILSQTSKKIKSKRNAMRVELQDGFPKIVEAVKNYNPNYPLVMFVDIVLSRLWLLLSRCQFLDELTMSSSESFAKTAWDSITNIIRDLVNIFTVQVGSKKIAKDNLIRFSFVESSTLTSNTTASSLRSDIGEKPASTNILLMYPLLSMFRNNVQSEFKFMPAINSNETVLIFSVRQKIQDAVKMVKSYEIISRPIKTDIAPFPLLLSTPEYAELLKQIILIAETFPFLQQYVISFIEDIVIEFYSQCNNQLAKYCYEEDYIQVMSSFIMSSEYITPYIGMTTLKNLVFKNNLNIPNEFYYELSELEFKYEKDVFDLSITVQPENTIRQKYTFNIISAIIESMIYMRELLKSSRKGKLIQENKDIYKVLLQQIHDIILKALLFIRFELHYRIYSVMIKDICETNHNPESISHKPDSYAINVVTLITQAYEQLQNCVSKSRLAFLFYGVPQLIAQIFIKILPTVSKINEKGSTKIINNIKYIYENIASLRLYGPDLQNKVFYFVSRLHYTTDSLLSDFPKKVDTLSLDEMISVFKMQKNIDQKQNERIQELTRRYHAAISKP